MVRLARCCTPVPGDEIIGFVTRGRGVSVHRSDCANAASLAAGEVGRLIEVEWDRDRPGSFLAALEIKALDRSRLRGGRLEGPVRPPPQHLAQREPHGRRPGEQDAFRVRAGRPGSSRVGAGALKRIDSVYDAYRLVPEERVLSHLLCGWRPFHSKGTQDILGPESVVWSERAGASPATWNASASALSSVPASRTRRCSGAARVTRPTWSTRGDVPVQGPGWP